MTSTIKVNNIQNQCGANIINENSNTITIGASGDTIALASGASQTGFGSPGQLVDWQTGSIKTSTFTAASGEGYFANTSGGAFTMNLPAGTAGNIVAVVDYTNTFQTNNLTIAPNGAQKIGGIASSNVLSTKGQSVTFVYVDDTEGWKNVQDSTSNVTGNDNILATGGTITTCGDDRIHTFTGPGTFTVNSASGCAANNVISYLVVAGAGGAGGGRGGGGGAGGFRELKSPTTPYTASPLDGYPTAPNRVTVTAQAYPITVGAGGVGQAPGPTVNTSGSNSIFSTITSAGGGKGGAYINGTAGGSGGGGSNDCNTGGAGNTPPVTPPQGNSGGNSTTGGGVAGAGGGGGATAAGGNGNATNGGPGGAGATTSINGTPTAFSGGGGGGADAGSPGAGAGGTGGGGAGSVGAPAGTAGTTNRGGGGGGTGYQGNTGGAGGSGIVILRYKFR